MIEFSRIVGYTMIHTSAFVVLGTIAAALMAQAEDTPPALFPGRRLACFFEVGFYVLVAILAQPLLGALAWWSVAIGNAIAAGAMGFYLWRHTPRSPPSSSGTRSGRRRTRLGRQAVGLERDLPLGVARSSRADQRNQTTVIASQNTSPPGTHIISPPIC